MTTTSLQRQHFTRVRTALAGIAVVIAMVGLSYAAVPIYRIFCQVTGFAGTTQRAVAAPDATTVEGLAGRQINVRFDGNVRGLPWQFFPVENQVRVKIGEQNIAYFRAANTSTTRTTGSATFNVTPLWAGKYFVKMQCFCFNEQTLAPGHRVDMPVVYFVDPAILDDPDARKLDEITLSYSFYPVDDPKHAPAIRATGEQMAPVRVVG